MEALRGDGGKDSCEERLRRREWGSGSIAGEFCTRSGRDSQKVGQGSGSPRQPKTPPRGAAGTAYIHRPKRARKGIYVADGPRIKKNGDYARGVHNFCLKLSNSHQFLTTLPRGDFRAQAQWFCTILQNHRACAQSSKPPRLCIKIGARSAKHAPKLEF